MDPVRRKRRIRTRADFLFDGVVSTKAPLKQASDIPRFLARQTRTGPWCLDLPFTCLPSFDEARFYNITDQDGSQMTPKIRARAFS